MRETYQSMMEELTISQKSAQEMEKKLEAAVPRRLSARAIRAAVIAACLCLAIPVVGLAADHIFGLGILETMKRPVATTQEAGQGYNVTFETLTILPVTEFSSNWASLNGTATPVYASWEAAAADLGLELADNTVLSQAPYKQDTTDLLGVGETHCYGLYHGMAGQLYCAEVVACYANGDSWVTLAAKAVAQHDSFTEERLKNMHDSWVTVPQKDVVSITSQAHMTEHGIPVTIVISEFAEDKAPSCEAAFAVDGISYRVFLYGADTVAKGVEELIRVVEGFAF